MFVWAEGEKSLQLLREERENIEKWLVKEEVKKGPRGRIRDWIYEWLNIF